MRGWGCIFSLIIEIVLRGGTILMVDGRCWGWAKINPANVSPALVWAHGLILGGCVATLSGGGTAFPPLLSAGVIMPRGWANVRGLLGNNSKNNQIIGTHKNFAGLVRAQF